MKVRANADTPLDARTARAFGAEGIGLCRTEHMFFEEERIAADARDDPRRTTCRAARARARQAPARSSARTSSGIFREMAGLPVTIRLLDPPLHEFLPTEDKQLEQLSEGDGRAACRSSRSATKDLHEFNPMLGHRGCRLAITFPEIYAMQVRAILEAAVQRRRRGRSRCSPEIMIPLAMTRRELDKTRAIVDEVTRRGLRRGRATRRRSPSAR